MSYRAILFDMDGTLVPMDTEAFTKGYFVFLFSKLAKYGLDPKAFAGQMWAGVAAMVKNDGTVTNEEAFWTKFEELTGIRKDVINEECLEFYGNDFHKAQQFTGENPLAAKAIAEAREKAEYVVLATNPLFPMVGQHTRMSWVGLEPEQFDLITSYESDTYCKPNPMYFVSICERLNVKPEECLMIGNDEGEDMAAASSIGMDCYLVTDCRIPYEKKPWAGKMGTFAEMVEMLRNL